jgi:hypothetical protein
VVRAIHTEGTAIYESKLFSTAIFKCLLERASFLSAAASESMKMGGWPRDIGNFYNFRVNYLERLSRTMLASVQAVLSFDRDV